MSAHRAPQKLLATVTYRQRGLTTMRLEWVLVDGRVAVLRVPTQRFLKAA